MQVTNNDKVAKWFFYKVNGQTKKVNIPGQTSVSLPDLISINQVIRNGYDVKVDHINSLLNRRLSGDFTVSNIAVSINILQGWYDSLFVKPSAGLWTALQTMANGMNSDGNWQYLDLFGMVAGMETDEQRLRPLKTTSGNDFINSGTTLDVSGATSNGTNGYINLKWNPASNGVNFHYGNADYGNNMFIGAYIVTPFNETDKAYLGSRHAGFGDPAPLYLRGTINSTQSITHGALSEFEFASFTSTSSARNGYKSIHITYADQFGEFLYNGGVSSFNMDGTAGGLMDLDLFGCGMSYNGSGFSGTFSQTKIGAFLAGGGANQNQIDTRITTFLQTRGVI